MFPETFRMQASKVAELLLKSKRPLIHIGQGRRHAERELFRLLDVCPAPFVTARNGNDLVSTEHPLNIGRPGTFAQRGANFCVQLCDCYIAIGTRLSLTQTGYNSKDYARNAKIVQIDIDQAELDKGTLRDPIKMCLDAKVFLEEFEREWHAKTDWIQWSVWTRWAQWNPWLKRCQNWKQRYPVVLPEYKDQQGSVNSYYFIDVLSDLAKADDIIVTDMGFAFQNTHQAWKVKKGQRLLTNCGLAPMGWGLPAAIGACIGTGRRVICITGEGGLMMNIQELATVMHHKLNIKIFVLNNGGFFTLKQTQQVGVVGRLMGGNEETCLSFQSFHQIALAHGIYAYRRIDSHVNFNFYLDYMLNIQNFYGPVITEIIISSDQPQ